MKRLILVLALFTAPLTAKASNCSEYTYTLINGQVADANQVMSNFNNVLNCANNNLISASTAAATYAPLASPALTGTPTAPTGATNDSSTQIATDAFVATAVAASVTPYAPLASPALTGTPTAPTAGAGTSTTQLATTAFVGTAVANAAPTYFWARNQQTSGTTSGETITATAWTQRVLNTAVANTISGASLGSNQITLPAGTYEIFATQTVAGGVGGTVYTKGRLRDVTASTTLISGQNYPTSGVSGFATLQGKFTLAAAHAVELDMYAGQNLNGGIAASSGEVEVYVDVYIRKVG